MALITDLNANWRADRWPNFSPAEFRCRHTGACRMDAAFLYALQALRRLWGRPMIITSGYRAPSHPLEARKPQPGAHALGIAADIAVEGVDGVHLFALAAAQGFTGLGFGADLGVGEGFVHLDTRQPASGLPCRAPFTFWSYERNRT